MQIDGAGSHLNSFNTKLLRPRQWLRSLAQVTPSDNRPVRASVAFYDMGPISLAWSTSSAAFYVRDAELAATCPFADKYLLQLVTKGKVLGMFGDGMPIKFSPGDIYVSDLSCCAKYVVEDTAYVGLVVPKAMLADATTALHGHVFRRGRLLSRMLVEHMQQMVVTVPSLAIEERLRMNQVTVQLLRAHFSSETQAGTQDNEITKARMLAFILKHLAEPDLGARTLQRVFQVSRSQVYRLFEDTGGVQRYISDRRLEAAFSALSHSDERSIEEIQQALGYRQSRQFQRAFRATYGMSATDVRRQRAVRPKSTSFVKK